MSRMYKNRNYSCEADIVQLFAEINIGASGAVSSSSGLGIASVVKESTAGQYSIAVSDKYNKVLFVEVMPVLAASASGIATVEILEAPASLQTDFKADKTFKIQLYDEALAAVNAASGTRLLVKICLRRSTLSR